MAVANDRGTGTAALALTAFGALMAWHTTRQDAMR